MGVNYKQFCLYGIEIIEEDICTIVSPKVTEDQPRYDIKTGKVEKYETVLVKDEVKSYEFMGLKSEYFYGLYELLCNKFMKADYMYNMHEVNDRIYIGCDIGDTEDLGRAELLYDNDDIDIKYLQDCHKKMVGDGFTEEDLGLRLFYSVG